MSKAINLGRLSNVELRNVFASEATDFTPWLAEETNLALLGETIGIQLQLEATEKDVGPFRADILCRNAATDHWVLVENQIERTDHTHLGQLLTYAAGLEAATIVWIAQKFTEEHRAALDWLNAKTDEEIDFFGLEIELWRIGDSAIAPKFNVKCQPNEWSRTVKPQGEGGITDNAQRQLRFWTGFKAYMEENSKIGCYSARPASTMIHPFGKQGYALVSVAQYWNSATNSFAVPELKVGLEVVGKATKQERYAELLERKKEIETAIGEELVWSDLSARSLYILRRKNEDFRNEEIWPQLYEWYWKNLELFKKVFTPILAAIDQPETEAAVAVAAGK